MDIWKGRLLPAIFPNTGGVALFVSVFAVFVGRFWKPVDKLLVGVVDGLLEPKLNPVDVFVVVGLEPDKNKLFVGVVAEFGLLKENPELIAFGRDGALDLVLLGPWFWPKVFCMVLPNKLLVLLFGNRLGWFVLGVTLLNIFPC